jgi:hypothetical protein
MYAPVYTSPRRSEETHPILQLNCMHTRILLSTTPQKLNERVYKHLTQEAEKLRRL